MPPPDAYWYREWDHRAWLPRTREAFVRSQYYEKDVDHLSRPSAEIHYVLVMNAFFDAYGEGFREGFMEACRLVQKRADELTVEPSIFGDGQ